MKDSPVRRRPKVLRFLKKDHRPMTPDTLLAVKPVYEALDAEGIDWRRIPEKEFAFVVRMWRRDRIAKGTWMVDWQSDGANYVVSYAKNHHWDDEEVVDRMNREKIQRKPGDLTDAERDAMGYEKWLEWSSKDIE